MGVKENILASIMVFFFRYKEVEERKRLINTKNPKESNGMSIREIIGENEPAIEYNNHSKTNPEIHENYQDLNHNFRHSSVQQETTKYKPFPLFMSYEATNTKNKKQPVHWRNSLDIPRNFKLDNFMSDTAKQLNEIEKV